MEAVFSEIENLVLALVAITAICMFTVWSICTTCHRVAKERTRREMLAYLAEGSITSEDAKSLMEQQDMEEVRRKITAAVSDGEMTAEDAAKIMGTAHLA